ncbi:MAG: alpha/beta hydrolase, partial [Acidobacteriota bacterium]
MFLNPLRVTPPAADRGSLLLATLLAGLLALTTTGCSDVPPAPVEAPVEAAAVTSSIELTEELLPLESGETLAYDRGVLTAPLRRDKPASPPIEVEFFRFRRTAEASPDTPPIFVLHGGPGFGGLGPRLEDVGYFEARVARYTAISDVIVPGQRGFGSSTDTPCDPSPKLSREEALDPEIRARAVEEAAAACRQKWRDAGLDPWGFNVVEASTDVVEIARLLDYEQIQLRGISFGSHWGMAILRRHPELIARAVLASLEGPDHTYDMPSWTLATLERIAASAEASPALASRIPEGGLIEAYRRLIERAEAEPIEV